MKIDNFFSELKRRNVYKVAIAYAVVAWLLIQAASILFPSFDALASTIKILVIVLVLSFPIVGGGEGACPAATGSWTACSRRIAHAELRCLKSVPGLGPAPRRSALRRDRRLPRAEGETIARRML